MGVPCMPVEAMSMLTTRTLKETAAYFRLVPSIWSQDSIHPHLMFRTPCFTSTTEGVSVEHSTWEVMATLDTSSTTFTLATLEAHVQTCTQDVLA